MTYKSITYTGADIASWPKGNTKYGGSLYTRTIDGNVCCYPLDYEWPGQVYVQVPFYNIGTIVAVYCNYAFLEPSQLNSAWPYAGQGINICYIDTTANITTPYKYICGDTDTNGQSVGMSYASRKNHIGASGTFKDPPYWLCIRGCGSYTSYPYVKSLTVYYFG